MTKRLSVFVDDDIPDMLLALAEGQRKQGEFLSNVIRSIWENGQRGEQATVEGLRFQMLGVIAEVHELKRRLVELERKT